MTEQQAIESLRAKGFQNVRVIPTLGYVALHCDKKGVTIRSAARPGPNAWKAIHDWTVWP